MTKAHCMDYADSRPQRSQRRERWWNNLEKMIGNDWTNIVDWLTRYLDQRPHAILINYILLKKKKKKKCFLLILNINNTLLKHRLIYLNVLVRFITNVHFQPEYTTIICDVRDDLCFVVLSRMNIPWLISDTSTEYDLLFYGEVDSL